MPYKAPISTPKPASAPICFPLDANTVRQYTEDYEPHEVEEEFSEFCLEHQSGYWYLTAEPGKGKTAIMVHLAQLASTGDLIDRNCVVIEHFFRHTLRDADENKPEGFYTHAFERLRDAYDIEIPQEDNAKSFWKEVKSLARSGRITPDAPLIFLIDSLDEMTGATREDGDLPSKLELPVRLDEGVYIAVSERHGRPVSKSRFNSVAPVCLETAPHKEKHKRTVEKYFTKRAVKKPYIITPDGEEELRIFAETLCRDAGHNFEILKCVLNDKGCWNAGNIAVCLKTDIFEFFENYVRRIFDTYPQKDAMVILCMAFEKNVHYDSILACATSDTLHHDHVIKNVIGRWTHQKLLLDEHTKQYYRVLNTFHEAFYAYLKSLLSPKKQPHDFNTIASLMLNNLEKSFEGGMNDASLRQRVAIFFRLCVAAGRHDVMRRYLLDQSFWEKLALVPNGLDGIFKTSSVIRVRESEYESFLSIYNELVPLLNKWSINKTIKTVSGKSLRYKDFMKGADRGAPATTVAINEDGFKDIKFSVLIHRFNEKEYA